MLIIHTVTVTPYQQNARILIDDQSNECVIVDPGGDIPLILQQLPDHITVTAIWITHSHIDHVSGVSLLLSRIGKNRLCASGWLHMVMIQLIGNICPCNLK